MQNSVFFYFSLEGFGFLPVHNHCYVFNSINVLLSFPVYGDRLLHFKALV